MIQRLYIDTSVFGGYFDDEFSSHTVPLFERHFKNEFIFLYSSVTQEELSSAPDRVKKLVSNLKSTQTEYLEATTEAIELANEYISENVVGRTSFAYCYSNLE